MTGEFSLKTNLSVFSLEFQEVKKHCTETHKTIWGQQYFWDLKKYDNYFPALSFFQLRDLFHMHIRILLNV